MKTPGRLRWVTWVCRWSVSILVPAILPVVLESPRAWGLVSQPSGDEIETALNRGKDAARSRVPPDRLYSWFGSTEDLEPHGFLMTKLDGLAVMATHFALRGEEPGQEEIANILNEKTLLISIVIFGSDPEFAVDSYVLMKQGDRTIIPDMVRFDGRAKRSAVWPNPPAYQAKVISAFAYSKFDPMASSTIEIVPGRGKEVVVELELSRYR